MREIRFRAWDGKEMYLFDLFGTGIDGFYIEGSEIMQYTGLRDKNGTEIYEGDVIEYPNAYRAVVEWVLDAGTGNGDEKNGWYIRWLDDGTISDIALAECGTGEVIGNIYKNPELVADPISQ